MADAPISELNGESDEPAYASVVPQRGRVPIDN